MTFHVFCLHFPVAAPVEIYIKQKSKFFSIKSLYSGHFVLRLLRNSCCYQIELFSLIETALQFLYKLFPNILDLNPAIRLKPLPCNQVDSIEPNAIRSPLLASHNLL